MYVFCYRDITVTPNKINVQIFHSIVGEFEINWMKKTSYTVFANM